MGVQAIFYVESVSEKASGSHAVRMVPVAKGPYAAYSQYTPSGEFTLTSVNSATLPFFREHIGKDVRIVIDEPTEADLIA